MSVLGYKGTRMAGCKIAPVPQQSYVFSRRYLYFLVGELFLLGWVVCRSSLIRSPAVNCISLLFIYARALFQYACLSLPAPPSSIFCVLLFLAPVSGTHFIMMIMYFLCISGCVLFVCCRSPQTIWLSLNPAPGSLVLVPCLFSHLVSHRPYVLSRREFHFFVLCPAARL